MHVGLACLLEDRIVAASVALPPLPLPTDPRAARVAEIVLKQPHKSLGLDELSSRAGASRRTLERLFVSETGLSFGRWRRRAIMLAAARFLGGRAAKVEAMAVRFGYESTSALIGAFRAELGRTPGAFAREGSPLQSP